MTHTQDDRVVGIQIGAASFVDEGTDAVLDELESRASVNTLLICTPSWIRAPGGRQDPGPAFPDHGRPHEGPWRGGCFATVHPEFYEQSALGPPPRSPDLGDYDVFVDVMPRARARGMRVFAMIPEHSHVVMVRGVRGYARVLERDAWGRLGTQPCLNHPDYRAWRTGMAEEAAAAHNVDGILWCPERITPLAWLLSAPAPPDAAACFCQHCERIGRDRGYDPVRAREGFRRLYSWNRAAAEQAGRGGPAMLSGLAWFFDADRALPAGTRTSMRDGVLVEAWRILLEFPEILAWQRLYLDAKLAMMADIYGTVKAVAPRCRVGVHVWHAVSLSPFFRAEEDYCELAPHVDYFKPVTYDNCGGPRLHGFVHDLCRTIFADTTPSEVYPVVARMLNLPDLPFEALPSSGLGAEYVRRETERAMQAARGTPMYPGIDIDIPTAPGQARSTPEQVLAATRAALAAGASGVILSRSYSEMNLSNLSGAGKALT